MAVTFENFDSGLFKFKFEIKYCDCFATILGLTTPIGPCIGNRMSLQVENLIKLGLR